MATAFARLQKIRTFYVVLVGVGALGFALFSIPLFFNLFLEHEYGLDAFDRGLVNAATYLPALVVIPDRRQRSTIGCFARAHPGRSSSPAASSRCSASS